MNRRSFLTAAPLALGAAARAEPLDKVRVGFVGVGNRGRAIVRQLLRLDACEVVAVCDLLPDRVARIEKMAVEAGRSKPAGYSRGEEDYLRLCDRDDLDLVATATPWELHSPVCVAAMERGKHAATETPASRTLEDCWNLVEGAERSGKQCILMENYCYFRETMCVLNMVRQGLFGDPIHVYTGYQKESEYYNFKPDGTMTFAAKGAMDRMGNIYPTHFVGPCAQWLGINRGDAFDYLVSMGTSAAAFDIYTKEQFGPDHPFAAQKFDMCDISNTLIRTKKGRVFTVIHDTRLPRPYRHYFRLQATNGIYEHIEKRVFIQGRSPGEWTTPGKGHETREWEPIADYYEEFEHPLWRDLQNKARSSGHGGGDYLCMYRMIEALRTATPPDIDVYDAAAWSAIIELSEQSARDRSRPRDFPDFTRGKWKTRPPMAIVGAAG